MRSKTLVRARAVCSPCQHCCCSDETGISARRSQISPRSHRSEEHTSELQSPDHLVCRLLLEKKKKKAPTLACRSEIRIPTSVVLSILDNDHHFPHTNGM